MSSSDREPLLSNKDSLLSERGASTPGSSASSSRGLIKSDSFRDNASHVSARSHRSGQSHGSHGSKRSRVSRFTDEEAEKRRGDLGYSNNLRVGLDGFMAFSYSFSGSGCILTLILLFSYGLGTGGPVAMVWGWLTVVSMTMIVVINVAEMCSAYPHAGSIYIWSGNLAPREYAPYFSYWTAIWLLISYVANSAALAYGVAQFLNSALAGTYNDYVAVGVSFAVLFVWCLFNLLRIEYIGWLANLSAGIQIALWLGLILVLTAMCKNFNTTDYVFFHYNNNTGFTDMAYVLTIGLLYSLAGNDGYDGSAAMAEETQAADVSAPYSLIYTVLANGLCGFVLTLVLLFTVQDEDGAIAAENGAVEVVRQVSGSEISLVFAWILVVAEFFCGLSFITVATRLVYALSRDHAIIPYGDFFSVVDEDSGVPVRAMLLLAAMTSVLLLLPLMSAQGATAFYTIVEVSSFAFQISIGIPIFLKVFFLCPYAEQALRIAPFSLGHWSWYFGSVAFPYQIAVATILLLPTLSPVDALNFNYTSAVAGIVIILGTVNWELNSKFHFKGPKRSDDDMYEDGDAYDDRMGLGDTGEADFSPRPGSSSGSAKSAAGEPEGEEQKAAAVV